MQLNSSSKSYMMMENLTAPFEKPCVLDLKMGTRMHGDFATPAKRESQKRKCQLSTSLNLGVRLCGSLWYDPTRRVIERMSKYEGRTMTETEFRKSLLDFVSDGRKLRSKVAKSLLDQLIDLRRIISRLDSYRFYSRWVKKCHRNNTKQTKSAYDGSFNFCLISFSSLLIVYEGKNPASPSTSRSSSSEASNSPSTSSSMQKQGSISSDSSDEDEFDEELEQKSDRKSPPSVVVKMIDFAHSTFEGFMGDPISHSGPDHGYIKGLDSLIELLESALDR